MNDYDVRADRFSGRFIAPSYRRQLLEGKAHTDRVGRRLSRSYRSIVLLLLLTRASRYFSMTARGRVPMQQNNVENAA